MQLDKNTVLVWTSQSCLKKHETQFGNEAQITWMRANRRAPVRLAPISARRHQTTRSGNSENKKIKIRNAIDCTHCNASRIRNEKMNLENLNSQQQNSATSRYTSYYKKTSTTVLLWTRCFKKRKRKIRHTDEFERRHDRIQSAETLPRAPSLNRRTCCSVETMSSLSLIVCTLFALSSSVEKEVTERAFFIPRMNHGWTTFIPPWLSYWHRSQNNEIMILTLLPLGARLNPRRALGSFSKTRI